MHYMKRRFTCAMLKTNKTKQNMMIMNDFIALASSKQLCASTLNKIDIYTYKKTSVIRFCMCDIYEWFSRSSLP